MFPCVDREERDHVEIEIPNAVNENIQLRMLLGSVGSDDSLIPFPMIVESFQFPASEFATPPIRDGGANGFRSTAPNISGEAVFSAAFHSDAAKTRIPESVSGLIDADPEIMRVELIERILCMDCEFALWRIETFA